MKRFTETNKWRDPWFQALSHGEKLLFLYLIDNCDNAGFYEENVRETCFHLDINPKQYEAALKGLGRGIKGASGWLWIRRFLFHQKNSELDPVKNPAHRQIVLILKEQSERFKGVPEFQQLLAPTKGLPSPIGTGTGKVQKKRKRVREKPESEFADRLAAIFHRNGSSHWTESEVEAFNQIKFNPEEITMLERYYKSERDKPKNICRRDLQTLLNNYPSEVDRARAYGKPQQSEFRIVPVPKVVK